MHGTQAQSTVQPNAGKWCAVVDLDNLLNRGRDKSTGRSRPQGALDLFGIAPALRWRGVADVTVCRNREWTPLAEALLQKLGFKTIAVGANVDDVVIREAKIYARNSIDGLVILAGDSDYCDLVKELISKNIQVEVWCRRSNFSHKLASMATYTRFLDDFLAEAA